MKRIHLLTAATAVLALASCNKNKNESGAVSNEKDKVTITESAPPPGGTWADVVNATSAGGVMMGNPNAKVKLIEIGSLSCPHCKAFEDEGFPALVENYVKPGKISYEFRPYLIHGPIDITADLIVRCNGTKTFFPLVEALYKDQPTWMGKLQSVPQDKMTQIQNLPPNQMFTTIAGLLGLQDWAAAHGIPHAKSNQCLSDQTMINQEVQISSDVNSQYPEFQGTPTFVINGKMLPDPPVGTWDELKPKLDEAVNG